MVNCHSNLIKVAVISEGRIKWYYNNPLRCAALWEKGSYWYIPRKVNLLNPASPPVAMVKDSSNFKSTNCQVFIISI